MLFINFRSVLKITTLHLLMQGTLCLRDVYMVAPEAVERGSKVVMKCMYDLENEELYQVKWYRGDREFCRYAPREVPPLRLFPIKGIDVVLETANERPLEHALDTVLEDHNSQNIAIPTPVSPAVLIIDQPEEQPALDTPAPPLSLPSQSPPPPPPPPLPRTPPARNIRRQAPRSPSTTPRRALLRARRNRGLTPFERAADLFVTVEQRRLEHEETRDERLHEREMERLRLEAERIDITRQHNNLLHQLSLLGQQLIDVITQQRPSSLPSTDPI